MASATLSNPRARLPHFELRHVMGLSTVGLEEGAINT